MKTKSNKILLGALFIATLGFNSCKKEETVVTKNDDVQAKTATLAKIAQKQSLTNILLVEMATISLPQIINKTSQYMKTNDGIENGLETCATVTIDSSSSPRIATLDFSTNCSDTSGHIFSGIIRIQYTDPNLGAAQITVEYDHFFYNGVEFHGSFVYSNNGRNVANNIEGTLSANLTTSFARDNVKLNGTTDISFEYIDARNTSMLTITGNGIDENGFAYTQATTEAISLNLDEGCNKHFTKGKLEIQTLTQDTALINYGTGACDDQATRTVNGIETSFTLE